MAKKARDDSDPNFDSLMDAVTNVVGVLMIVFVMMSLNLANSVRKILSELPPVTEEELEEIQEQLAETPPLPKTPEEIEEEQKLAQEDLQQATEELRSVDVSDMKMANFLDLEEFRKRIEEARINRDKEKEKSDELLAEVERLKALLDETPEYKPEDAKIVRLPNPRAYPEEPNETRVMIAKAGSLFLNQNEFLAPLLDGLDKVRSQIEYDKNTKPDPFVKMLTQVLGNADQARKAWPDIAPLAGNFQLDEVATAWKTLSEGGFEPTAGVLTKLGDIAVGLRSNLPVMAGAVVALSKGDFTKWTSLDPSNDPSKPTIQATTTAKGYSLSYGSATEEVQNRPRDLIKYFDDLADRDNFKDRSRNRTIYDAYKILDVLKRASSNQAFTKAWAFEPTVRPGQTTVRLELKPASGAGETLEQMKQAESNYQRVLRQIAGDPNGVAVFQVMGDAFDTYLEARLIADENRVPATWEFLGSLDISLPVRGFEVQKFSAPSTNKPKDQGIKIQGPSRKLD